MNLAGMLKDRSGEKKRNPKIMAFLNYERIIVYLNYLRLKGVRFSITDQPNIYLLFMFPFT